MRRSLAAADALAVTVAVLGAMRLDGGHALHPVALLALPFVVLVAKLLGIYDRDELLVNRATLDEVPTLFQLATLCALAFTVLQGALVSGRLTVEAIVALWGAIFLLTFVLRAVARRLVRAAYPPERCLFVGSDASAIRLRGKLESCAGRAELVGRMSLTAIQADDVPAATAALRRTLAELRVQRVVIEPTEPVVEATLDFVREAKVSGVHVSLLPRVLEVVGTSIEVDDVDGITLLGVRRFGLSRSSAMVKRAFDLILGGAVAAALSPLMAVIALLVRLDSGGPSIYRQVRIGRDGEAFLMWKFRTMVDGADAMKPELLALNEAQGLFKIAADPRITRVGSWLRKTSLDELPQLYNVLRGEMSLVGPRPLVPGEDAQITGLDRRRLQLTPGMTGPWQILGSARVPLPEMVKLDYLYVTGWSLWSDVKLLLRTVPYVLARRGM